MSQQPIRPNLVNKKKDNLIELIQYFNKIINNNDITKDNLKNKTPYELKEILIKLKKEVIKTVIKNNNKKRNENIRANN